MPKKGTRKCLGCGLWKTDVTDGFDPFDSDVLNKQTPVRLCEDCYRLSADEV
jgi:hypothetical protein